MVEHAGRPRLTSHRRRSWKQFFLGEWGLLLLAAVLTYIIWDNVRDQVLDLHTIPDIQVDLVVEHRGVRAVLVDDGTVDIEIHCSEREKDEVKAALKKEGNRVRLLVGELTEDRDLSARLDKFQWKFDEERLLRKVSPKIPSGRVFRTKNQKLTVARPEVFLGSDGAAEGSKVEVSVPSPSHVDLDLPAAAEDENEPLVPDNLDLSRLIQEPEFQPDTPIPFTLTFDGWRSVKPGWRGVYRQHLRIPPVTATVTVRQVGRKPIQNALLVQLDPNNYEYEIEPNAVEGVVHAGGKLLFTGMLKGRTSVLKELDTDAGKRGWSWAVRITDSSGLPPKPAEGADSEWVTLDASIAWIAYPPFRARGIEFEPKDTQKTFDLKVRWHPAHK